ncbi:MAG: polyprenyl synthetase family protein [Bacteroidetes bacterium]|nr:polyprenyl synthetase family protein [Bacteroidota bacterium]
MSILDNIKQPVKKELDLFEDKFYQAMKSPVSLLDKIVHYIIKYKGKQIRPLFVFLTAKMFGEITESTYRAAALIELLHTATLVHDDVVDDSYMRRGVFSINALWKNKIAVLVGDYFLSRGLLLSVNNSEFRLLGIVSDAVKAMSEGELLQIEKNRKPDITEDDYLTIIRQKTAALFSSSCAAGAASVTGDATIIRSMKEFGEAAGIAFQIKDDLLDIEAGSLPTPDRPAGGGQKGTIGKPTGTDLKSKTLTLPVIYTLTQLSGSGKKNFLRIINNGVMTKAGTTEIRNTIIKTGGIEYARKRMNEKVSEALSKINPVTDNPAKESLVKLVDFIVSRPY